jgi:uncharacterized membrane protein YdbT with pleckstrin-like domain
MRYVDRILEPGENVRYRGTVSWTVYVPAVLLGLCALAALVIGASEPNYTLPGGLAAAVLALGCLFSYIRAWFRRRTTEIAVTDRRVIVKRGFIRRHTVEMNMQKVVSIDVDQTIAGRIFNYGAVTIHGQGDSLERLARIDSPLKLRTTLTAG